MPHRTQTLPSGGRRWWLPLSILALGAGSLLLLVAVERIQAGLIQTDVRRIRAIQEIRFRISTTHLWLEEFVSGDRVSLSSLHEDLARAARLTELLAGRESPAGGEEPVSALSDPDLRREALELAGLIRSFRDISFRRLEGYTLGEEVGIGSLVDREYDEVFAQVFRRAERLEELLLARQQTNQARSRLLIWILLVSWAALLGLGAAGIWRLEVRRARMEKALRGSELQLLQAQKMEAIGRLAGGIAHDLNNVLAAIRTQVELARRKAGGEGQVRRHDAVLRSVDRGAGMIRKLLAFSRRQPGEPRRLDLEQVLHEGAESIYETLLGSEIQLEQDLKGDLWPVHFDPADLEQILMNLLVNAREAMGGRGQVRVRGRNQTWREPGPGTVLAPTPGPVVELEVADEGAGIPPEIRDRIFEPFFSTRSEQEHSGLGLATVYGILQRTGGGIELSSDAEGTRFRILIPAEPGEAGSAALEPAGTDLPRGRGELIFLVEDNEVLRRATRELLEDLGYRVTEARSAEAAVAAWDESVDSPDLLLTDVIMRDMDGVELARTLRERSPRLPVLYMSGNAQGAIERHSLDPDRDDFLAKPFSGRDLAIRVRQRLDRAMSG